MDIISIIKDIQDVDLCEKEPLGVHSTMRVGGVAAVAAFPKSVPALCELINALKDNKIKHAVIGNASNTVFPDGEYDGVIIFTKNLKNIADEGDKIVAECGVNLIYLSSFATEKTLSGAEFLSGIPGTVGGAVYMNAGAYGKSVSDIVSLSKIYLPGGSVAEITNAEHKFAFRKSVFHESGAVVLSTTFALEHGYRQKISAVMTEMKEKRSSSQPLGFPSAGSVFLPAGDTPAWKLIDGAGLRGYKFGGARVSEKHAGFIVNEGGATAADIKTLVAIIKKAVFEKYGVELKTEIIFIE